MESPGKVGKLMVAAVALLMWAGGQALALAPEVKNLGPAVNSEASDLAPVVSADGNFLYFTSNREGGFGGQDIWVSKRVNGQWQEPENLGPPLNDEANQGVDFYYRDEQGKEYLFLTICSAVETSMCDLYISEKEKGGGWSKPKNLGPAVNTEYSEANASWDYIHRVLYFVSTRPGGIPGDHPIRKPGEASYDIWRIPLQEDGSWGEAEHLPPPVNTSGWEGVAFYHAASGYLYFSSNGHGGEGGADIFRTRETSPGVWAEPEPMDAVNTPYDDIYLSIPASGELAYFSSANIGGLGMEDIYAVPLSLVIPFPELKFAALPGKLLDTVYFKFDRSEIDDSEKPKLDKIVALMNENLGLRIRVDGHTDSLGSDDYNLLLSKKRAEAVLEYLRQNNINPDRVEIRFFGETRPAEPNDPENGNPRNRRAEIYILQ